MNNERFVTVAEAVALLGVSERRIRHALERSAKRGENAPETRRRTLRTKTGERSATAYPEAWVRSLIDAEQASKAVVEPSAETGRERSRNGSAKRSVAESTERSEWRERALVAEARAELLEKERDRLADALTREQETARALADRMEDADQRLASVLAATGRLQIGDMERDATFKPTGGDSAPDPGQGDTQPAPEERGASTGRTEGRGPSWWARLWGRA